MPRRPNGKLRYEVRKLALDAAKAGIRAREDKLSL
jgi:hypothetical protein